MVHPVQASATQTEIMTKVGNAWYNRGHSSRTCLVTVAVTGHELTTERATICGITDKGVLREDSVFWVPGQVW